MPSGIYPIGKRKNLFQKGDLHPRHWQGKKRSEEDRFKMKKKHREHTKKPPYIETRIKISNAQKGEKGSRWKGGVTEIHRLIRSSLEYRLWREAVFKRDNYTCIWCGAKNGNGYHVEINADHIKPFAYFPELRFAIDNGRTLCVDCHKKTDTYGYRKIVSV